MTENEKRVLKAAKMKWRNHMHRTYPEFKVKKWARTGYRLLHPQIINNQNLLK